MQWRNHSAASAVLYSRLPVSVVLASIPSDTVDPARSSTSRASLWRFVVSNSPSKAVIRSRDHSPNHGYPAATVGPVGVVMTNWSTAIASCRSVASVGRARAATSVARCRASSTTRSADGRVWSNVTRAWPSSQPDRSILAVTAPAANPIAIVPRKKISANGHPNNPADTSSSAGLVSGEATMNATSGAHGADVASPPSRAARCSSVIHRRLLSGAWPLCRDPAPCRAPLPVLGTTTTLHFGGAPLSDGCHWTWHELFAVRDVSSRRALT